MFKLNGLIYGLRKKADYAPIAGDLADLMAEYKNINTRPPVPTSQIIPTARDVDGIRANVSKGMPFLQGKRLSKANRTIKDQNTAIGGLLNKNRGLEEGLYRTTQENAFNEAGYNSAFRRAEDANAKLGKVTRLAESEGLRANEAEKALTRSNATNRKLLNQVDELNEGRGILRGRANKFFNLFRRTKEQLGSEVGRRKNNAERAWNYRGRAQAAEGRLSETEQLLNDARATGANYASANESLTKKLAEQQDLVNSQNSAMKGYRDRIAGLEGDVERGNLALRNEAKQTAYYRNKANTLEQLTADLKAAGASDAEIIQNLRAKGVADADAIAALQGSQIQNRNRTRAVLNIGKKQRGEINRLNTLLGDQNKVIQGLRGNVDNLTSANAGLQTNLKNVTGQLDDVTRNLKKAKRFGKLGMIGAGAGALGLGLGLGGAFNRRDNYYY